MRTMSLAIATIFRNEAPYLQEWIEFHRLVGVETFYLFNNLSTDSFQKILQPYLDQKIVTLTDWPLEHTDIAEWNEIQCLAYERAIYQARGKVEWLALIDLDEFLFSPELDSLPHLLTSYKNVGGIGVNWQTFAALPRTSPLLIEQLTLKFPQNTGTNHHIKSIVQPQCVESCQSPHFVIYKPGFFQVDTSGCPFEGALSPSIQIERLRINHYTLRDVSYFKEQKIPRLRKWWHGETDWEAKYKPTTLEEDREIHRFLPQLKTRLQEQFLPLSFSSKESPSSVNQE